jgi:hypothetical protein
MTLLELRNIHNLIGSLTENDYHNVLKKHFPPSEHDYLRIGWNEFCDDRIGYVLRVDNKLGEALLRKAIERRAKISVRLERTKMDHVSDQPE